ncbi:MAG TPA: pseudouridine synthase [Clostridia bacterium]|nr:pseudouridine synthase [Clostridia bacterium]HPO53318.1 pseudouridine synthase [Clostridia bacterium]
MVRLNKYIADCGVCSRRAADKLITDGLVSVNGKVVKELGATVDETNDAVYVEGRRVTPVNRFRYIMLNKPKGCICSVKDDKGRKTIFDYVNIKDIRLFPIGRLDYDSEGLVLLTNDGALAHKLTHPSHEIPKTYIAKVEGTVPESDLAALRNGIELDDIKLRPCKIKLVRMEEEGKVSRFEVTIFEGRNRQIRRMFEAIGKEVIFLKRVSIGDLKLGGLGRGEYRYLTEKEISKLKTY